MAVPDDERQKIQLLINAHEHEKPQLKALNDEYEGRSPRSYMHPEVMAELGDRIQQVVMAWPQLVVDALDERLDVEGFRLPNGDSDADLWRVWQANDADEQSQLATIDALTMRRSYISIGTNEADEDTPLVSFESPLEVFVDIDPRTRAGRRGIRRYGTEGDFFRPREEYLTFYEPNQTVYYDITKNWKVLDRDEHKLGTLPLVPMVNRSRLADWRGRSELDPVLPLVRAANKLATDALVAAEFVVLPLRGIFGVGPKDFVDAEGSPLSPIKMLMGRMLAIPDNEKVARHFEFASAQLTNFFDGINQMARLVASLAGLPPDYLGLATENPPSAESRLAGEIRLIKRAERKQRTFGGSYEKAMRIVRRLQSGEWDPELKRLETNWRNAATPTVAQTADAAVKKYTAGITTLRQTRLDLGYTDTQVKRMEEDDELAAARDPLGALTRAAGQATPVEPAGSAGK